MHKTRHQSLFLPLLILLLISPFAFGAEGLSQSDITKLAIDSNDFTICEKITRVNIVDTRCEDELHNTTLCGIYECYSEYAKFTKDASPCPLIKSRSGMDSCYYGAGKKGETELCYNIENDNLRSDCLLKSNKELNSYWILQLVKALFLAIAYIYVFIRFRKWIETDEWKAKPDTTKGLVVGLLIGGFLMVVFESLLMPTWSFITVPFGTTYILYSVYGIGRGFFNSLILMRIFGSGVAAMLLMGAWGAIFGKISEILKARGYGRKYLIAIIVVIYILSIISRFYWGLVLA